MNDKLIIDNKLDIFIYKILREYKGKLQTLCIDHLIDSQEKHYLKLVSIVIKTEFRNQGIGKEIMNKIIKYAEAHNMNIKLWATDIFGTPIDQIIKFYEKFGFKKIDEDNNMILTIKNKSQKFFIFNFFNYICNHEK